MTHDTSVHKAGPSGAQRFVAGALSVFLMFSGTVAGTSASANPEFVVARARAGQVVFSRSNPCSGPSRARLVVRRRDASTWGITYKVRGGEASLKWSIFMENHGNGFYAGSRISGDDGYFRVRTSTRNLKGTDRLLVGSNNSVTGEICRSVANV